MSEQQTPSVAIIGGGSAGWMTAAALARALGPDRARRITVVEPRLSGADSGAIRRIEACQPRMAAFNAGLGLSEANLIRHAAASVDLGVEFKDWGRSGRSYITPFGEVGASFGGVEFQQHWLAAGGDSSGAAWTDFSLAALAARGGRFARPSDDPRSIYSTFSHGLHLNVDRYAALLRHRAEALGVRRIEGALASVERDAASGAITAAMMEGGGRVEADLFIDCTGAEARLSTGTWEDWSAWLPCDRAISVSWETDAVPALLGSVAALDAGWRWRTPALGHVAAGVVFDSRRLSDEAALRSLRAAEPGAPADGARIASVASGRRAAPWSGNCVAIGHSGGQVEPMDGVALHLVHTSVSTLVELFPNRRDWSAEAAEFNRRVGEAYDRVRDFAAAHYATTKRHERFWRDRERIEPPQSLAYKLDLFRARGRVALFEGEAFSASAWLSLLIGQGLTPSRRDPLTAGWNPAELKTRLEAMRSAYRQAADAMPPYAEHLRRVAG